MFNNSTLMKKKSLNVNIKTLNSALGSVNCLWQMNFFLEQVVVLYGLRLEPKLIWGWQLAHLQAWSRPSPPAPTFHGFLCHLPLINTSLITRKGNAWANSGSLWTKLSRVLLKEVQTTSSSWGFWTGCDFDALSSGFPIHNRLSRCLALMSPRRKRTKTTTNNSNLQLLPVFRWLGIHFMQFLF